MEIFSLFFLVAAVVASATPSHNLLAEQPRYTLLQLARRERKSLSTIWRWCLKGVRGHRLEYLMIGHRRYVTGPSWERFVAAINAGRATTGPTPAQRNREIDCALQELDELGI